MKTHDSHWNPDDLIRRVDRSLDFAQAAISLVRDKDPGIDMEALEAPPDKIIAETAMLLRAVVTLPGSAASSVRRRAAELAEALSLHARHARVGLGIALFPALALDYGAAHIVLASAGYADPQFSRTIMDSLGSTTSAARERFPHRELEQAWLISLLTGATMDDTPVSRTALAKGIDVISGSRDDAYSLTHALMYATDFGINPNRSLPADQILSISRSALSGILDDDDFDLAGELLLSWPFLGREWDNTSSFAFGVLASVEDDVGVLPSLALDLKEYQDLPAESRKNYVAAVAYHTAYVMGLLCSSALRAGKFPRKTLSGDNAPTQFTSTLLEILKRDARTPQWMRYAESLPEQTRNACASFFLDVAIRRHVRRTEFGEAHQLISEASGYGIEVSKLFVQAAEMLNRLARFTSCEAMA